MPNVIDQLIESHRLCVEADTERPVQSALANVLQAVVKIAPAIPVIIVGTKMDKFLKYHESTEANEGDILSKQEEIFKKIFQSDPETASSWPQLTAKFAFVARSTY